MTERATDAALREALVRAGRRLGARGLVSAAEGNLSVRLADGAILLTPSGLRKDELGVEDLVVVAEDGRVVPPPGASGLLGNRRPTSDLAIHQAIYGARPDVRAVAHAHAPATLALTLAGERADPAALPETALLLPRLPFVPFEAMGSQELAQRIVAVLADGPEPLATAALLERHGAVAVGTADDPADALVQAVDRLELVEVLCRTTRDAMLLRAAVRAIR